MPESTNDPWLAGMVLAGAAGSLATWVWLMARWRSRPLLQYQPRPIVPWGPTAGLLSVTLVLLTLLTVFSSPTEAAEDLSIDQVVERIAMGILQVVLLVGTWLAIVIYTCRPTARDLGLPVRSGELGQDLRIGIVAWLASLLPVFGTQTLLLSLMDEATPHPLIEIVLADPQPIVLGLAFVAAVVVAPVFEEIAFRLLLQGWLEKWEDQQLGLQPVALEELPPGEQPQAEPIEIETHQTAAAPAEPPRQGVAGLPYGWVPILVSSMLFALAHVGYGPDPIPLFLLALVLGYTYQRTHRILPCIAIHMLFNLLSSLALWRMVYPQMS